MCAAEVSFLLGDIFIPFHPPIPAGRDGVTNKMVQVYVEGVLQTTFPDTSGMADWIDVTGNLYFSYVANGTDSIFVDEV